MDEAHDNEEVQKLRARNTELEANIASLTSSNAALASSNAALEHKVQSLLHELYGKKSERQQDNHPELPFSGDEPEQTFKHNQITVLETKYRSVEEDPYSLYDYGEDVVVELDLICEYIFNRKGYEEIKPEAVKKALKAEEQTAVR